MQRACSEKIEMINELVSGNLDHREREAVERHISECIDCQKYFKEISAVKNALGTLELKPSADIKRNIMSEITKAKVKSTGSKWLRPAYVASYAAAACLVLVFSLFWFNGGLFRGGMTEESSESFDGLQNSKAVENQRNGNESDLLYSMDSASEEAAAVPAPEAEMVMVEQKSPGYTAKILEEEGYSFHTSAFGGSGSDKINEDGLDLAGTYGYSDGQDILYITANYSLDEVMNVLTAEYSLNIVEKDEVSILAEVPDGMLASIEIRLDLAAGATLDENSRSYLVRILSIN